MALAFEGGRTFAADPDPLKILHDSLAACEKIKDFTAVFTKQEQIDGVVGEPEKMELKFRAAPFSVYMRWLKRPNKGREVIYVEGKYDGLIVGHQPMGPLNFTKRASPDSPEMRKQSRRQITQAGFRNAIKDIVESTELGRKRNEVLISHLGMETIEGRPTHVICRVFTAARDDYPVHHGVVFIDKEWLIPLKVAGYDWDHKPLGIYGYSCVKLNVGLPDKDFDIANPDYSFPGVLPLAKVRLPWPFGGSKEK